MANTEQTNGSASLTVKRASLIDCQVFRFKDPRIKEDQNFTPDFHPQNITGHTILVFLGHLIFRMDMFNVLFGTPCISQDNNMHKG